MTQAFRRCVSREPTPDEADTLLGLLRKQTKRLTDGELDAAALAANSTPLPSGITDAQLAAWTVVARVLLNLDETITKE